MLIFIGGLMPLSFLDNQSFGEVEKKLERKKTITPAELNRLKILSNSAVVEYFKKKILPGEKYGKRTYCFLVSDVLQLVKGIIEKKDEIRKEEREKYEKKNHEDLFTKKKDNNQFLIERLEQLIKDIKDHS